jgi:hypothetical protein
MLALVMAASLAGCGAGTRACKPGTLFVDVTLAVSADTLDISVMTGSGKAITATATLKPDTTTGGIEIDFPHGYPMGQEVTVSITALAGGQIVGSGSDGKKLGSGCDHFSVSIGRSAGDAGISPDLYGLDLSGRDLASADLAGVDACVQGCPAGQCGSAVMVCGMPMDCPCPVVNALHEPFTQAGDTITIEGSGFVSGASVAFPGGATAPATVISPERLLVTVPTAAGNGTLSVVQNGNSSNAMAFRRASFAVGVNPTRANYEQAEYGYLTPSITPRFGAGAVVGDKYVWVLGGFDGTTNNNIVEQALINADGTLGAWKSMGKLTVDRYYPSAQRIGNWVYVLGGVSSGTASKKIERAPINSDGTIGTFADAGTALTTGRFQFATAVVGGWLYAFGGLTGTKCNPPASAVASIERAPIAADGTVGAFADTGFVLPDARNMFTTFVAGHTLYALGGGGVAMAPIAADGTIGTFTGGGGASSASAVYASFGWGGQLFEIGNFASNSAASAPYTLDGMVGTFAPGAKATGTSSRLSAYAVVGHYLYGFGDGIDPGCSPLMLHWWGTVTRTSLDGGDDLTNFAGPITNGLQVARSSFQAVVLGDKVYVIGGQSDFTKADVEVAALDGSGTLGSFSVVNNVALNVQRSKFGAAVVGSNLYIVGGVGSDGATATNAVEVATIASDGTLGNFAIAKAGATPITLATPRAGVRLLVVGAQVVPTPTPQLCALGGSTEIDCAAINADGTLAGNLTNVGQSMVTSRVPPEMMLIGTQVTAAYGTASYAAMEATQLNASSNLFTASFAAYNTGTIFPGDGTAGTVLGSSWVIFGGHTNTGGIGNNKFVNTVAIAKIDPSSGAVTVPGADANSVLAGGRSGHRVVVLENQVYTLGGGQASTTSDVTKAELR